MNRIARNVSANAFGGIWIVALNLLAIPMQIHILGTEAYGLIGFITTIQTILIVFDLGIPSTVVREVALDIDEKRSFSSVLVQTCGTVYWLVALIVGGIFIIASEWIARHWLHLETIPISTVIYGLRLLAVYIIFLWPLNVYSSALAGLQRFDTLNVLKITNATSVQIGGIIVLLLTHDLLVFIGWLILNAAVFLFIYISICYRLLPELSLIPHISMTVVKRIWKFSFDLNVISTFAVIYTQIDRLVISAVLPLRMLGYYNAAYNISVQIASAQNVINGPIMPALSAKTVTNDKVALNDFYVRYAQALVYLIALPAFMFIFFSYQFLNVWAGQEVAVNGASAMSLLALGFLLNASMSTNYTLAVASGHTRIIIWVNVGLLFIYFPLLIYFVVTHGIVGAALAWVGLNLYHLSVFVPLTQRRILGSTAIAWLRYILLPFSLLGTLVFGTGWLLQQGLTFSWAWLIDCIACAGVYTVVGFFFLAPSIRQQITAIPHLILLRKRSLQ
jgi:O-antigen/teichoic acid export membrane protein